MSKKKSKFIDLTVRTKQVTDALPSSIRKIADLTRKGVSFEQEFILPAKHTETINRGQQTVTEPQIMEAALRFFRDKKRLPTIQNLGISAHDFYEVYNSIDDLHNTLSTYLWEQNECIHLDLHQDKLRTPKRTNRYLITCVAANKKIHDASYKTLQAYCRATNTELVLLPVLEGKVDRIFDSRLKQDAFILAPTSLHDDLLIVPIRQNSKVVNPTVGTERYGQRTINKIFPGTKQVLKSIPVNPEQTPLFVWVPGSITQSDYQKDGFIYPTKQELLAEQDHTLGALIVEVRSGQTFVRDVQFNDDGSFTDLGIKYSLKNGKLSKKQNGASVVLGDLQTGQHAQIVMDASRRLCKLLKANEVIVHDGFDGYTISHWERKRIPMRAQLYKEGRQDLRAEIKQYADELKQWLSIVPKIFLVKSNHDEFLNRYLNDLDFKDDVINFDIACELAPVLMREEDPLEYALRKEGLPKSVVFGKRNDTYKIAGIEVGQHGDKGANGARGSIVGFSKGYDKSVKGHSHSPDIDARGVRTVGNMIGQVSHYGKGCTSSWAPANNVIYDDGTQQMIIITRDGKF